MKLFLIRLKLWFLYMTTDISCIDLVKAAFEYEKPLSIPEEEDAVYLCGLNNVPLIEIVSQIFYKRNLQAAIDFIRECRPGISDDEIKEIIKDFKKKLKCGKNIDKKLKDEIKSKIPVPAKKLTD